MTTVIMTVFAPYSIVGHFHRSTIAMSKPRTLVNMWPEGKAE
jgi:hypothetical protein